MDQRAGFEGHLLGVLLAGDIVNGKQPICTRVTQTYGGYAAVFHVHPQDVNAPPHM